MWLIPLAALIIGAPFAWAWWLGHEASRLRYADKVWGDVEYEARILLEDRTLPPVIGDLVEFLIMHVGTGKLTRNFAFSLFKRVKARQPDAIHAAIYGMEDGQHTHFLRLMMLALLYDSLRAGIVGAVMRRFVVYWLNATMVDRKSVVSDAQAEPIIRAAERQLCLT